MPADGFDPAKRIFCIGFNKTATVSLTVMFRRSGIPTIHWGGAKPEGNVAHRLMTNFTLARPLLEGLEEYGAFCDLSYATDDVYIEGNRLFREMYAEYPDAYFLLNTRDTEGWVKSRFKHRDGHLARRAMSAFGMTEDELRSAWAAQHVAHEREVVEFFGKNASNFLRFDIAETPISELAEFLAPTYAIKTAAWGPRHNNSEIPEHQPAQANVNQESAQS